MNISKQQARKFLVVYHQLHSSNPIIDEEGLLTYIKKVGCIQFDPINVLAYNSHLVLQSRYKGYKTEILDKLLYEDFQLIDAWDKNLSIYSVDDDRFFHRYRLRTLRYYEKLNAMIHEVMPILRQRMKLKGPTSSIDIKNSPRVEWAWAPTKAVRAALDYMFSNGEIYVHHKINTRKYYALIEQHPNIQRQDSPFNDDMAYFSWHIHRRIGGVGILPALKDTYGFIAVDGLKAQTRRLTVQALLQEGHIQQIQIEGIETPYFIREEDVALLKNLDAFVDDQPQAKILAALDNLIWDRDMIEEIYDFKYRWEVYVPENRRIFGYYVLPILYGYNFIGRIIMKFNRQNNTLEINQWYFENGVKTESLDMEILAKMFDDFADFLGAGDMVVAEGAKNRVFIRKVLNKCHERKKTS